jgi:beta-phosphoglucomutase-like phosphatase (HAD superfamily)
VRLLVAAELQLREYWERYHVWRVDERERLLEEERLAKAKAEREERERQERLARERIERLLNQAEALQKAETIRRYVARVREITSQSGDDSTIENWAGWALNVANRLDPVRTGALLAQSEPDPESEPEDAAPLIRF